MKREHLLHLISNQMAIVKNDERYYSLQYAWDIVSIKAEGSIVDLPDSLMSIVINSNQTPN